jgi:hypothetical protein
MHDIQYEALSLGTSYATRVSGMTIITYVKLLGSETVSVLQPQN